MPWALSFRNCPSPVWHLCEYDTPILCLQFILIMTRTCLWSPMSSELLPCDERTVPWGQRRAQQREADHSVMEAPCPSMLLGQFHNLVCATTTEGKFRHDRLIKAAGYFEVLISNWKFLERTAFWKNSLITISVVARLFKSPISPFFVTLPELKHY